MSYRLISGFAEPESTAAYFSRLKQTEHHESSGPIRSSIRVPDLDLHASRIGFGSYRLALNRSAASIALREALVRGINVIDTAPNYGFGLSEEIIGTVMRDLIMSGSIQRSETIIIGKTGCIQGSELKNTLKQGEKYNNLIPYRSNCWHSMDPDFIQEQIQGSLKRLQLASFDIVLLQNPEFYLEHVRRLGMPKQEAYERLLILIETALHKLEHLRERGLLRSYGICSDTMQENESYYGAMPLNRILEMAPPGFRVIQLPANLLEADFKFNRSASGGLICEQAARAKLWTISHRSFYARRNDGRLIRMARLPNPPLDEGAAIAAELNRALHELSSTEKAIEQNLSHRRFRFDDRTESLSAIYQNNSSVVEDALKFMTLLPEIQSRIKQATNRLFYLSRRQEEKYRLDRYIALCNEFLGLWYRHARMMGHEALRDLEEKLGLIDAGMQGKPLSIQVLVSLLASGCPQTILVGMRKIEYVQQILEFGSQPGIPESALMRLVATVSDYVAAMPNQENDIAKIPEITVPGGSEHGTAV